MWSRAPVPSAVYDFLLTCFFYEYFSTTVPLCSLYNVRVRRAPRVTRAVCSPSFFKHSSVRRRRDLLHRVGAIAETCMSILTNIIRQCSAQSIGKSIKAIESFHLRMYAMYDMSILFRSGAIPLCAPGRGNIVLVV